MSNSITSSRHDPTRGVTSFERGSAIRARESWEEIRKAGFQSSEEIADASRRSSRLPLPIESLNDYQGLVKIDLT